MDNSTWTTILALLSTVINAIIAYYMKKLNQNTTAELKEMRYSLKTALKHRPNGGE